MHNLKVKNLGGVANVAGLCLQELPHVGAHKDKLPAVGVHKTALVDADDACMLIFGFVSQSTSVCHVTYNVPHYNSRIIQSPNEL